MAIQAQKIISSKKIYTNPHLEAIVDTVTVNNHTWEQLYLQKPYKNAVGVIPLDETGIYLVNQYRYPIQKNLWQIVMGALGKNQSPLQAAKKELLEEAGIQAESFSDIGSFYADPGICSQKITIFAAETLHVTAPKPEVTEFNLRRRYFTFVEITTMLKQNEIECGFTLRGLLLLQQKTKIGLL